MLTKMKQPRIIHKLLSLMLVLILASMNLIILLPSAVLAADGNSVFDIKEPPVASSGGILSLTTAPDGVIYGGTANGHLFSYNPGTGISNDLGLPYASGSGITALTSVSDGRIFGLNKEGYIFSHDPESQIFENHGQGPINTTANMSGDLLFASDGLIYGGTDSTIFRFLPSETLPLTVEATSSPYPISYIIEQQGKIYIIGGPGNLQSYDTANPGNGLFDEGKPMPTIMGMEMLPLSDGTIAGGAVDENGQGYYWTFDPSLNPGNRFTSISLVDIPAIAPSRPSHAIDSNDRHFWGIEAVLEGGNKGIVYQANHSNPSSPIMWGIPRDSELAIPALTVGLDGRIYGGTAPSGYLFSFNPATEPAIDTTPPTTTLLTNPAAPDGNNGWFKTQTTATLSTGDPTDTTHYRWDNDSTMTASGPISVPEGCHILTYYSTDTWGNVEEIKTAEFKVDTQAPTRPINLTIFNITSGGFDVSWDECQDNVAVVGYNVHADTGELIGQFTTNLFSAQGMLPPNTTVGGYVVAYDEAGNLSEPSDTGYVTTLGAPISAPTLNGPATSIDGQITLYGKANPNSMVEVYDQNSSLVCNTTSDNSGNWSQPATLTVVPGQTVIYTLTARSVKNGETSSFSLPLVITLANSVPVLGTTNASDSYSSSTPDANTGISQFTSYSWQNIYINVPVENAASMSSMSVEINGQTYPLDDIDGDGVFNAVIPAGALPAGFGQYEVVVLFTDFDGNSYSQKAADIVLIDPSGYVYDIETGNAIQGATVTLYKMNDITGIYEVMDPMAQAELMQPDINPQITNLSGWYGWDVAPGSYKVLVQKNGYLDTWSREVVIVNIPVTDLDVAMERVNHAPSIAPMPDISVNEGDSMTITPLLSDPDSDPLNLDIYWYGIDFPAESFFDVLYDTPYDHIYPDNGAYPVTLKVTDDDGGMLTTTVTVTVSNVNPTVDIGPDRSINEGDTVTITPIINDPSSADTHDLTIDWGDGVPVSFFDVPPVDISYDHVYPDNGTYTVIVTVTDDDGGIESDTMTVAVAGNNTPPGENIEVVPIEGVSMIFESILSSGNTTALSMSEVPGTPAGFEFRGQVFNVETTAVFNGLITITLAYNPGDILGDEAGLRLFHHNGLDWEDCTLSVDTVNHNITGQVSSLSPVGIGEYVGPEIEAITGPIGPQQIGSTSEILVSFSDLSENDCHGATIDWGDNTVQNLPEVANHTISSSHIYSLAGVYEVTVTVTDSSGTSDNKTFSYVVTYDPSGGFVTGGGWIDSPSGAYTPNNALDDDVIGKASFGFVSKYKKGTSIPEGNTQFQFKTGNLNFNSSNYEWLVVAGNKAKFKGIGSVNGQGLYGFMLTAVDSFPDSFRIKIWDALTNEVIYDNKAGLSDINYDTTTLGGGSIVVHNN